MLTDIRRRAFAFGSAVASRIRKAMPALASGVDSSRGWIPLIREPFAGAWQRNITVNRATVLTHPSVWGCIHLIASDIAKLRPRLVQLGPAGIWTETTNPAYSPIIRKPNINQTRCQFWESWLLSKLAWGNCYALKGRDARGVVYRLYVLDPSRVHPLVTPDGELFYRLATDNVAGLTEETIVPASEIIHDRWNTLYHPYVGLSPIIAAGLAATQAHVIQTDAAGFFANGAMPSGILTAPGAIGTDTAKRLKEEWQTKFSGSNAGNVAVLGDGLKFEAMRMQSTDAQLVEQLKWTSETICAVFRIPLFMMGLGPMPSYQNVQALATQYYSQCLQGLIEAAETLMDDALGLGEKLGFEFDLSDLLRMDSGAQIEALTKATGAGIMSPNEARQRLNLPPVVGGEVPLAQQQYYPINMLANRPAPPALATPSPAADPPTRSGLAYRGVWREDTSYSAGQFVTDRGALWHCEARHRGVRPGGSGGAEAYWKLTVKRGQADRLTREDQEDAAWRQHGDGGNGYRTRALEPA